MTRSNIWALIIGALAVGGVSTGAIVWQRNHPDAPALPSIAKLTAPPSLLPPKTPSVPAPVPHLDPRVKAPSPQSEGEGLVKGPPPKPEPASGHGEPPHFDVVRVEPSGDAVLAGKGDPNAKIALMASGKVLSETKSDPTGQFVLMPPTLKPGAYDLSLRQTPEGQGAANKDTTDSKQTVAVSVPAKPHGEVVIALAEPGKPTKLLSGPPVAEPAGQPAPALAHAPPPAAPPSRSTQTALAKPETAVVPPAAIKPDGPDLAIRSVELENGDGFFASGVAPTGTRVQIYLNDSHLTEVTVGRDHQWSVTVKRGLSAGHYIVRADASGEGRMVTARVEVPFDVPVAMAAKPAEAPVQLGALTKPPADVAARLPHDAPPARTPQPTETPNPEETAAKPPVQLGTLTKPPADVAARLPHDAPPAKVATSVAPTDEAAGKSSPSVIARSTPPEPPTVVPTPRPDVAAAAKAKSAAAPSVAPPVLAVSPPVPPKERPTPPPAKLAVAPPRPATAPPALAAAPPTIAPKTITPPSAANAIIEAVETVKVVRGDNLWNISRDKLGGGYRYTRIYEANNDQIRDPKLIYPGQVFVMPSQERAK